jgi:hypothetical protein
MIIINKRKGTTELKGLAAVELARTQVARLQKVSVNPRKQITSRPDLCSDHVSVEATVYKIDGTRLGCATWNVADPHYYKTYHDNADSGFEDVDEKSRLVMVRRQVQLLLSRSDCVALQEVPASLAPFLDADAERAGYSLRMKQPKPSRQEACPDAQHLKTYPRFVLFVRSGFSAAPPSMPPQTPLSDPSEPSSMPAGVEVDEGEGPVVDSWEDL